MYQFSAKIWRFLSKICQFSAETWPFLAIISLFLLILKGNFTYWREWRKAQKSWVSTVPSLADHTYYFNQVFSSNGMFLTKSRILMCFCANFTRENNKYALKQLKYVKYCKKYKVLKLFTKIPGNPGIEIKNPEKSRSRDFLKTGIWLRPRLRYEFFNTKS